MRSSPKDVAPLVHDGVRYEAPHFEILRSRGSKWLKVMSQALEQAARQDAASGREFNPQDPTWARTALEGCGAPEDEKATFLDLLTFQATVAPVLQKVTAEMMRKAFEGGGFPSLQPSDLRQALQEEGTLSAEQIDRLVTQASGEGDPRKTKPRQNGGTVVAYDESTGEELWDLQVYTTDYDPDEEQDVQDVFITGLSLEAGHLVVSDERGRSHRVDLTSRQVV